jgi:tetratricopeptide (TPR) repeat protein
VTVICQWCGAVNPEDRELCLRCRSKLLVFSGGSERFDAEDDESSEKQTLAFDEHVLERLSDAEEEIKRVQEALAGVDERLADLERGVGLLESGVKALIDLLDRRHGVRETEVIAAWERAASSDLARDEAIERLRERREMIVSRARAASPTAAATCTRALRSAELALLGGHAGRAGEILADAFQRVPDNPELAHLLGEMAFERDDLVAAERYFRATVRSDPGAVEARVFLGAILADLGNEEEASAELSRAAQLSPESSLPHLALGALNATAGRVNAARRHLVDALQRERLPHALVLLGLVELDAGRPGAACRALEEAVSASPDDEEATYYLGLAFLERGWRRRALECFRRVLELDPHRLQFQEAVRLLEAVGEGRAPLPPEAEQLMRQASQAAEGGDVARAMTHLGAALRLSDHPSLLASLALLASAAGRHRQAIAVAHRLLRTGARGAAELAAWTAILESLRATRKYGLADRWGVRLHADGSSPLQRALAAYELALIELERGGDPARALDFAHQALELLPKELRQHPLATLGRIHLLRKEYSDAVDYLEQAATISASPAVLSQLGMALLARGDGERARDVLQRARSGTSRDLTTDVLANVARAGFVAAHGRRKG